MSNGISSLLLNLPTASLVPLPPQQHLPFTEGLNSSFRLGPPIPLIRHWLPGQIAIARTIPIPEPNLIAESIPESNWESALESTPESALESTLESDPVTIPESILQSSF